MEPSRRRAGQRSVRSRPTMSGLRDDPGSRAPPARDAAPRLSRSRAVRTEPGGSAAAASWSFAVMRRPARRTPVEPALLHEPVHFMSRSTFARRLDYVRRRGFTAVPLAHHPARPGRLRRLLLTPPAPTEEAPDTPTA